MARASAVSATLPRASFAMCALLSDLCRTSRASTKAGETLHAETASWLAWTTPCPPQTSQAPAETWPMGR
eukprot:11107284-Alexandrium_andersonii.AAC.1